MSLLPGFRWLSALALLAGGCSVMEWPPPFDLSKSPPSLDLSPITQLEIIAHSSSGAGGGLSSNDRIVLFKGKPGSATSTHSRGWKEKNYELPPEEFEKCQAILRETHFLFMRSAISAGPHFEPSSSSLTVVWYLAGMHLWEHSVNVYDAQPPAGYDKISEYLGELETRGKVVMPKIEAPLRVGRDPP